MHISCKFLYAFLTISFEVHVANDSGNFVVKNFVVNSGGTKGNIAHIQMNVE